jgi:hypothetical protein
MYGGEYFSSDVGSGSYSGESIPAWLQQAVLGAQQEEETRYQAGLQPFQQAATYYEPGGEYAQQQSSYLYSSFIQPFVGGTGGALRNLFSTTKAGQISMKAAQEAELTRGQMYSSAQQALGEATQRYPMMPSLVALTSAVSFSVNPNEAASGGGSSGSGSSGSSGSSGGGSSGSGSSGGGGGGGGSSTFQYTPMTPDQWDQLDLTREAEMYLKAAADVAAAIAAGTGAHTEGGSYNWDLYWEFIEAAKQGGANFGDIATQVGYDWLTPENPQSSMEQAAQFAEDWLDEGV